MKLKLPDAFTNSIRLLYYRNYFSYELAHKLTELGYREKEIQEAIQKCINEKYLNDSSYSKEYIEWAQKEKKWGYKKICNKLKEKNIPIEIIKQYLCQYYSSDIETEIKDLLIEEKEKKLPEDMDSYKKNGILQRYLYQKGF